MPGEILIWVDGAAADSLLLPDRGLDFGDGLFETLLLVNASPVLLPGHLARLERGLKALRFPDCIHTVEKYLAGALEGIASKSWQFAALRLTVTRGSGPRGYAPPDKPQPRCIIQASRIDRDVTLPVEPASLAECSIRIGTQPHLAGLKHLNRLEQVLCAQEAIEQAADEAVMLNQAGNVVCVGTGNIFIVHEGRIVTPPIVDCGIQGTRRDLVIQRLAPMHGHEVVESHFTTQDMRQADEIFYTNSMVGLRPVSVFGEVEWSAHPVCTLLFDAYRGELR